MIIEVKVPSPGESITEVELGAWLVEDGDVVEMDDELVEINSDKATLALPAEEEGRIEIIAQEGDVVEIGAVIAKIDTSAAGEKADSSSNGASSEAKSEVETAAPQNENYATGTPSPSAEKMMKDQGISKGQVTGTGRDGRITKGDVIETAKSGAKSSPAPAKEAAPKKESKPAAAAPVFTGGSREITRKRMTPLRRTIADRLVSVKNETAMLTTFNEVDMTGIKEMRAKYKEKFKEHYGIGLGFMGFFVKACTEAMKFFPAINAQIDGKEILYHDYVDVGIAVSTQRGLVVPNIRNAESMSIVQVEQAIRGYAAKARNNEITIEDMTGGTFTITNGGIFGSMLSTPIINPPQSAILGMHNIVDRPVAVNGKVEIRPIMYVALSYDHRIVDGKEAVSFLFKVREFLEDPARLLIGI